MGVKPPAFQFYAKDWTSSHTIAEMTMHQRGIYITLLAAAWESEEPGTLPLPLEIAARSARLDIRSLRDFMAKFPRCFREIDGKLVNEKLHENWLNFKEISDKRRGAAMVRHHANAEQEQCPASAPAPAIVNTHKRRKFAPFQKPTIHQVTIYMNEIGIPQPEFEAEGFMSNHDSKGWKIQGRSMVDWKGAVRTWKHNLGLFGGNGNGRRPNSAEQRTLSNIEAAKEALRISAERDRRRTSGDSGSGGSDPNDPAN